LRSQLPPDADVHVSLSSALSLLLLSTHIFSLPFVLERYGALVFFAPPLTFFDPLPSASFVLFP